MTKANTQPQRGKAPEARFWEKVDKTGDCWLWTSALSDNGYGVFWVGNGRRSVFAHRFAVELRDGCMPPVGMVVMHSCDNKRCVNFGHLVIGTNSDNLQDASRKGRIARGERNGGGVKLCEAQVVEILRSSGSIGCQRAARIFNVSPQTIKRIRNRRNWKHVTAV